MLKCAGLYTYEVDDADIALGELLSQLDEKLALLAHSVGIVMCHTEFISSGVLRHICEHLPFDLVGVTTASQAVNGEAGELMLTVFVMTSDDVAFRTGVARGLDAGIEAPAMAAYALASQGMAEPPQLALVFPPLILKYAGDAFVSAWEGIAPNVPIFGTLAIDDTVSFLESETIYNGVSSKVDMPFVLCYGNIHPRFLMGTIPESGVMPYRGEISKSSGPYVSEINNVNAYKYFEGLGLASDGAPTDNFLFMPFKIDQRERVDYDGIPVLRVLASFTEDGTAIFRGNVDENSVFTLLSCKPSDIAASTLERLGQIRDMQGVNGVLLFSCIIRRMMAMGVDPLLELSGATGMLGDSFPFMMGYAGGEICPTSVRDGIPTNRFHNYTLIALIV